jgi:hypothetical protein
MQITSAHAVQGTESQNWVPCHWVTWVPQWKYQYQSDLYHVTWPVWRPFCRFSACRLPQRTQYKELSHITEYHAIGYPGYHNEKYQYQSDLYHVSWPVWRPFSRFSACSACRFPLMYYNIVQHMQITSAHAVQGTESQNWVPCHWVPWVPQWKYQYQSDLYHVTWPVWRPFSRFSACRFP